jgi:putative transposase
MAEMSHLPQEQMRAICLLARAHVHIANQRRDFHHKTARKFITQYGMIVREERKFVTQYGMIIREELNITGIARSRLAKSTYDVS